MTWKTKPSAIDPTVAERRLRLISELRDFCLSLAEAKRKSPPSEIYTFPPWTEADHRAWEQLEREAALRDGTAPDE